MTTTFNFPPDYGDVANGGHCGVLSVAICAGVTFKAAWDYMAAKHNANWQGSTRHGERVAALDHFGTRHQARIHLRDGDWRFLGNTPWRSSGYARRCSVSTFARKHAELGVTYMLRVGGHVVTLRDGLVIDQGGAGPAHLHRSSRQIVSHSVEVLS